MKLIQTAERVSQVDASDNYVFQRSLLAYAEAAKLVKGNVLEIGTGSGYGVEMIASRAEKFVTIDKFENDNIAKLLNTHANVEFIKMNIPPLSGIADNSFDFVITFQVIEHIKNDRLFAKEIHRVLKPGGKLIVTTPNKKMSLTRNPWHIREYLVPELKQLLSNDFASVESLGVYGNETVMDYYRENEKSVKKITRFDFLNLQYNLPRWCLQIPYDILNRWNRKKMLNSDNRLVAGIEMTDYYLAPASDECLDLFYVAEK
ncbi:MAG TPA: class I SAM-dependent methyltransferase [Niabella sp.]|nr:class I SAM-dependent methyltransferase [Niabella sp.]HQW14176.1 class I SAM-dependent methyltransferase [Niabella sp.]HQX19576.1 class I SAM-dependent methyltransferase [Niabella sp.]HQX39990.1 class I SAM-dependent methyltransferase [Niabella sp.]HRB06984.1 class I SAM-dependent methyltransferase [Niabella sp.]